MPRVVLYGLPNAGKSSLLNALVGDDAALVSDSAGTTRDFVARRIAIAGRDCLFSDTAGVLVREDQNELVRAAQLATTSELARANLRLLCIDRSRELTAWDEEAMTFSDVAQLVVFTKCDLPPADRCIATADAICTSSRTGQGLDELRQSVLTALESRAQECGAMAGTAERCRESLHQAGEALARAQRKSN